MPSGTQAWHWKNPLFTEVSRGFTGKNIQIFWIFPGRLSLPEVSYSSHRTEQASEKIIPNPTRKRETYLKPPPRSHTDTTQKHTF
jgi:hypothetical protein